MNLYAITFRHLSQKDSEEGIKNYVVLTPEQALDMVFSRSYIEESNFDFDEDAEYDTPPSDCKNYDDVKKLALKILTENQDEEYPTIEDDSESFVNYDDLYYGKTFYGYKLIKDNISVDEIKTLKEVWILK